MGRRPAAAPLLLLLLALTAGWPAAADTVPPGKKLFKLPFGQIRQTWHGGWGFCGEWSVQSTAAYYGVWGGLRAVSELAGRHHKEESEEDYTEEGHLEALLEVNMVNPLMTRTLGLNHTAYLRNRALQPGDLEGLMLFIKRELLAGFPVMFAARVKSYGKWPDLNQYDHIEPAYGLVYSEATRDRYDPTDELIWTSGDMLELRRQLGPLGSKPFYARGPPGEKLNDCAFGLPLGGCISSDDGAYALSVRGLLSNTPGLFLPMRLEIAGWSDGKTPAYASPRDKPAEATFMLDLGRSNLKPGETFTVFRLDLDDDSDFDSGTRLQGLRTIQDVNRLCTAVECNKITLAASASRVVPAAATAPLGTIDSESVVFFVACRGKP